MNQEEFNKLLKESGLPKEFNQQINELIRTVNEFGNKIKSLEAMVKMINSNINPG